MFTLVMFFAIIECGVRVAGFDAWQLDFSVYRNVPGDITPNQRIEYQFRNFDHRYSIAINRHGWREPSRLRDRPFRVLCVGDSSTLGFGVEDHEAYPAQLQKFLDGHFEGLFDVINAGVVGYTIDDELEYLLEKGFALEPSAVVLEVFWNDVLEKSIRRKSSQREHSRKSWPYMPPASWMMESALYQLIRNEFLWMEVRQGDFPELPTDKLQVAMEPSRHEDYWQAYDEKFNRLSEECRARGIPLIVVATPHQYQVYDWNFPAWDYAGTDGFQSHLAELCNDGGAQFVDLMPHYRELANEYPSLYLSEGLYDEHVGPLGQWIKAREVYQKLDEEALSNGFHNLYSEAGGGGLALEFDLTPGRLWRPKDDNGGLYFNRGGMAAVAIPQSHSVQRKFVFSAGLASIGEREEGVAVIIYDAEVNQDSVTNMESVRVLGEFTYLEFPTSDEIWHAHAELSNPMGNLILIVIDKPSSIDGVHDIQRRLGQRLLSPDSEVGSSDIEDESSREYLYFLRHPLIYPQSMTIFDADMATPDQ